MATEVEISIDPDRIHDNDYIKRRAVSKARIGHPNDCRFRIVRRSVDARKKPMFKLRVSVMRNDEKADSSRKSWRDNYQMVRNASKVYIIGAGPAGYFAALECLELGLCPVVLDRGKDVQTRRRDLRSIQQEGIVNPDSNYCFGEGGAGTYSDGKLYTRSKKKGSVLKVLQILVEHGANPEILIDAHPHIGSNKLPKIITALRETIEHFGGKVMFQQRMIDLNIEEGQLKGFRVHSGKEFDTTHLILATGHSARDVFNLLEHKKIKMSAKPFAMGMRIEHPQKLIDALQYGQSPRHTNLPASTYRFAADIDGTGVFSFCMCPGGLIVPAATSPGELVVNGMSLSRRDSPYANAGIVVAITPEICEDMGFTGPLGGVKLQQSLEKKFFEAGDGSQAAPAQRVSDFLQRNKSESLPASSYIPGLISAELHEILPPYLYDHLAMGLFEFDRKLPGFITSDSVLVGLESRTSSPVRIPRDPNTMMHPEVNGLFPCGEGAGFAGGIVSAAIDGQLVARSVFNKLNSEK